MNRPTMNRRDRREPRRVVVLLALGAMATGAAVADEPALGPAKYQDIELVKHYQFYVRGYRRPVTFDPAELSFSPRGVTAKPAELAMRALAARAGGRVEDYLALLSEEARTALVAEWAEQGISRQQQGERWRAALRGLHAELTHHVDFDVAELIRYRLFDPATGAEQGSGEFAFRIADGLWRIFEPEDQLFMSNWRFEEPQKTIEHRPDRSSGQDRESTR